MKNIDNGVRHTSRSYLWWIGAVLLAVLSIAGFLKLWPAPPAPTATNSFAGTPNATAGAPAVAARKLGYQVVRSYPHDRRAFLQGLLWHDGYLYESTGLEGQSTLRRVELISGRVLQRVKLPANVFGEGLALVNDHLIQISWQSQRAFIYDRASFKLIGEWSYEGEGWGLTYDGKQLIMSDGSDVLTFRDPETFKPLGKLNVTLNGQPLGKLNELEWIEGEVWANVWETDTIVRIDPKSGQVTSFLDLAGILPRHLRSGSEDVLNGIAYIDKEKRILVGGKLWPRLFEIRVLDDNSAG